MIDVREPGEVRSTGKVPGAINIPLAEFLARTDPASPTREPSLAPEKAVILYCASGKRSHFAGNKLIEFGYQRRSSTSAASVTGSVAGLPVDAAAE